MAPPKYNNAKIELDDDQKFALMKFRRSVSDVLQPHHDDYFLLRWLRARSWNAEAAEKMLRQSMKWRSEWEVDGALVKTWQQPEVVQKYQPCGVSGYDKNGAPVVVLPFGNLDIVGMLNCVSKQDLIRSTVQVLERNLGLAAETGANQMVVIFDMNGFSLRQYAWRPAAELIIQLIQMYEANYPEILKACFIINAPRVFAIAFNIVKKFMDAYTLSKIEIIKSDPAKWKKLLLEHIEPDNLPQCYGGNLTDPDGNPKLTTKIMQGGKIPKSYYKKNFEKTDPDNEREYTTVTIKKGDKIKIDFDVEENGSFLRWDFRTEGHDIRFGVTVRNVDGNEAPAVRFQRVAAHQVDESGVLACQAPAKYIVTFDNSYSLLRSKKLHYKVYLTPPFSDLGILPEDAEALMNGNKEEEDHPKEVTNKMEDTIEDNLQSHDIENVENINNSILPLVH